MNITHRLHKEQAPSKRRIRREIRAQVRHACMSVIERQARRADLRAAQGYIVREVRA